jgi:hypothetical protein
VDEKRKGAGENRGTNKTQTWEELEEEHWKHKKRGDYTEKERKAEEQHRDEYWLCHCLRPYRKRKTHNHSKHKFTTGWPLHHLLNSKSC